MRSLLVLLTALLTAGTALAGPATYSYVGNPFTTTYDGLQPAGTTFNTSQRVTGSLSFDAPLADMALGAVTPAAFSFSNGVHTFTQNDSLALVRIYLEVIGGIITGWDIQFNDQFLYANDPIGKQENVVYTRHTAGGSGDRAELLQMVTPTGGNWDWATNTNSAGNWTASLAVPEPGSMALAGLALLAMAGALRPGAARGRRTSASPGALQAATA